MNSPNYNLLLIEEARKWVGTEEKGKDNCGPEVEKFQKAVDGKAQGEAWCMAFVQFCIKQIEERHKIQCMVFKSEHCLTVFRNSQPKVVMQPQPGDLIIWRFGNTASGHVGIITELLADKRAMTIEGNTSDSQTVDREGDGVYEKNRSLRGSEQMKVMGFVRPF